MPKVGKNTKLNRVARRVAAAAPLPVNNTKEPKNDNDEPDTPETQQLSRGQRKRQAKRDQYVRKEKLILSSLVLKKQEEQKQRIDGLDAIRDALMNTTKGDKNKEDREEYAESYNTNKAKRKLVAEEAHHVSLVMQHPAFKADPFATIQEHLRNTLAEEKVKQELQEEQRTKKDTVQMEQQKRQKKKRLQGVKKPKKKFKAARQKG
jgi:hypothetical protein